MLRPLQLLGTFDEFGRNFCTPEGEQAGSSPAAGSGRSYGSSGGGRSFPQLPYQGCNRARLDELHKLLLANVMVRRTKAQVGLDLPSKTRLKVRRMGRVSKRQLQACERFKVLNHGLIMVVMWSVLVKDEWVS
jgi:hypothetical protein